MFAGVLVDRLDRRRLMIVCDVMRMVLHGAVPVCWLFGAQVWLLYVVMALTSVFSMIFKVSYVTAVPNLVGAGRIIEANGRLETTNAIAFIVGPGHLCLLDRVVLVGLCTPVRMRHPERTGVREEAARVARA